MYTRSSDWKLSASWKHRQAHHARHDHEYRQQQGRCSTDSSNAETELSQLEGATLASRCVDGPCKTNLDSFLECTTPSVQSKGFMVESRLRDGLTECTRRRILVPSFSLADLWTFYEEPSVYGVGVPISLPDIGAFTQYYIPYLSAVQIYVRSPHLCSPLPKQRKQGHGSDDGSEYEFSSDTDVSSVSHHKIECWETGSSASSGRSSSIEEVGGMENREGNLLFEYFEKTNPHVRSPFARKIDELANKCPDLCLLRSDELSSASWLSVAWYPTYRIPIGPTMHDWPTAFLTYHTLWTPLSVQDEDSVSIEHDIGLFTDPVMNWKGAGVRAGSVGGECARDDDAEQWLVSCLPWRFKDPGMLELQSFGLVSYKLSIPYMDSWASEEKRISLATSAEMWIKELKVHHPDFHFFCKSRY